MSKTWFITGASSDFGRSMTERLLVRGDRVAATYRRAGAFDDLQAEYGDRLWTARLELTDSSAIREVIDRAFSDLGRIDCIVSNAAYALFGAAEEATDAQVRHQIETNLIGSITLIQAVLPHLRKQGGGRILQVSSEGGQIAYPAFSLYHATKWGIEGFVESVAQEVAPFGIGLTLVEPGPASTNFRASLVRTTPMADYDASAANTVRQAVESGSFELIGDPVKMADAMITCADADTAPLRLTLGSTSYTGIRAALARRMAALDAQKETAFSTDKDR